MAVRAVPVVLAVPGAMVVMVMVVGAVTATAVMGATQTVLMGLMVPRVVAIPVPVR
jgi:hypothetical protein